MNGITGVFTQGRIIPDEAIDWPDGCRVVIEPVSVATEVPDSKDERAETPEEIADWLRWYDSLEPLEFTAEEEGDLAAWRLKVKEHTLANMHKQTEDHDLKF
jgi:hypothetical protein